MERIGSVQPEASRLPEQPGSRSWEASKDGLNTSPGSVSFLRVSCFYFIWFFFFFFFFLRCTFATSHFRIVYLCMRKKKRRRRCPVLVLIWNLFLYPKDVVYFAFLLYVLTERNKQECLREKGSADPLKSFSSGRKKKQYLSRCPVRGRRLGEAD